jgi:hypothetical protein
MDYFKDFKNGIKLNDDLNNKREGPHWDLMTDLRDSIRGVDKIRFTSKGDIINGETQIGPLKLKW